MTDELVVVEQFELRCSLDDRTISCEIRTDCPGPVLVSGDVYREYNTLKYERVHMYALAEIELLLDGVATLVFDMAELDERAAQECKFPYGMLSPPSEEVILYVLAGLQRRFGPGNRRLAGGAVVEANGLRSLESSSRVLCPMRQETRRLLRTRRFAKSQAVRQWLDQ